MLGEPLIVVTLNQQTGIFRLTAVTTIRLRRLMCYV